MFKKKFIIYSFLPLLLLSLTACDNGNSVQENTKKYNVALVQFNNISEFAEVRSAFLKKMRNSGYNEKNFIIHEKNAEENHEKFNDIIKEVTESENYDLILSMGTHVTKALVDAKEQEDPLFFMLVTDPKATNITKNALEPNDNITGSAAPLHVIRIVDLARNLIPNLKKAIIFNENIEPQTTHAVNSIEFYFQSLKIDYEEILIENHEDFKKFNQDTLKNIDAVFIPNSAFLSSRIDYIIDITHKAKVPLICTNKTVIQKGCLATVAVDNKEVGEKTAELVLDYINGKEIKDLPIYITPSRNTIINQDVAELFNITIPDIIFSPILIRSEK